MSMKKDDFINNINDVINDVSLDELRDITSLICKDIPIGFRFKSLCRVYNKLGKLNLLSEELESEIKRILEDFEEVKNGNVVCKCYETEINYGLFVGEYDCVYFSSNELEGILDDMYNLICKLVYTKNYLKAIDLIDLMLDTTYTCEEIGDPTYSNDYDTVLDVFDTNISNLDGGLNFDFCTLLLYGVYAVIMSDYEDKYSKINKYYNLKHFDIRQCKDFGIEEIRNLEIVYNEWMKSIIKNN